MVDEKPKPQTKRKKRPLAPLRDEHVRYLVEIGAWDWSYSFGLDDRKNSMDPYMEHRQLGITGTLIRPVIPSARTVELWLLPRGDLDEDMRRNDKPTAVGSLSLHDGRLTGLLPIPMDSLTPILQMLIADRLKFVDIGGARLRHRRALVTSFSLETHIDEDDMPSIERGT